MSSFDNSLFSNSINEAVSRQNASARVEETLEKHKLGIINAKEQLQASVINKIATNLTSEEKAWLEENL